MSKLQNRQGLISYCHETGGLVAIAALTRTELQCKNLAQKLTQNPAKWWSTGGKALT